jgi:hypothetical protein
MLNAGHCVRSCHMLAWREGLILLQLRMGRVANYNNSIDAKLPIGLTAVLFG